MPLKKSHSKKSFADNMRELMESGHPHKQSLAIALGIKRKAKRKK